MPIASTANSSRLIPRPLAASRNASSLYPRPAVLPRKAQPTVSSEDGHSTLRLRQHGNRSLPLPPLLDPKRVAAQERFTNKKPEADEAARTDFQKQLASNPFALALATPIRQCHHTRVRLPSHFLQPFTARIAPSTTPTHSSRPSQPVTLALLPCSRRDLPPDTQSLPTGTYVLNTRSTIDRLGKKRRWARIVGPRMQDQYARRVGKKDGKNVDVGREWVWDESMEDVVLEQLRAEVQKQLEGITASEDGSEHLPQWDPASRGDEALSRSIAAVLTSRVPLSGPGEHGRLGHVPTFPLGDMLGADGLRAVDEKLQSDQNVGWAVNVMRSRRTLPLLLAIHRLAMYLELDVIADSKANKKTT